MKGFIELTVHANGDKILCPLRIITGVCEDNGGTFIETGYDGKNKAVGIFVTESFEEVKQKIQNCEV